MCLAAGSGPCFLYGCFSSISNIQYYHRDRTTIIKATVRIMRQLYDDGHSTPLGEGPGVKLLFTLQQLINMLQIVEGIVEEEAQFGNDAQLFAHSASQFKAHGLLIGRDILQCFGTFL